MNKKFYLIKFNNLFRVGNISINLNHVPVLGLDTIFNSENVNTNSFTNGNGTYRVYAMLQDLYGNILFDGTLGYYEGADDVKAWYEFTVTYD